MAMSVSLQSWASQLPHIVLTAMTWALLARLVLSVLFSSDSPNPVWRILSALTEPVLKVVRLLTPAGVPESLVLVAGLFWLVLLRLTMFLLMSRYGLLSTTGAAT